MEYKLNMGERFGVLGVLPQNGDVLRIRTVKGVRSKMIPSEEDQVKFGMNEKDGRIIPGENGRLWNTEGDKETPIALSDAEAGMIAEQLRKLNSEQKLEERQLSLYEKFVEKVVEKVETKA